jgi:hypothetical protein
VRYVGGRGGGTLVRKYVSGCEGNDDVEWEREVGREG